MNSTPSVACSLSYAELQEREEGFLRSVGAGVQEMRELEDGYAYRFPADDEWLDKVMELVRLERQCCAFLQFRVTVEPAGGPTWLELTGPEGAKEFLASYFA